MLRVCLLCSPCLALLQLSFSTGSHSEGCQVNSFGVNQPVALLQSWLIKVFFSLWSSWRGLVLQTVSVGSVFYLVYSCPCALPVCTARRWNRRRRGGGEGGEEPLSSASFLQSAQPAGRATSSMPSNGPLFHTSNPFCPSQNFRKAHNWGLKLGLWRVESCTRWNEGGVLYDQSTVTMFKQDTALCNHHPPASS